VNARWNSPKFLLGESYGTTRAAGLSYWLQQKGLALNGVVLVSSWLNPYVDFFGPVYATDAPYELYLPTMAATAAYHHKLATPPADLGKFLAEVREFALGDYAAALAKGSRLTPAEQDAVAKRLSAYTGISADYFIRAKLRLTADRFEKELLRDSARTTGRLDARFTGIDHDAAGETTEYDPASAAFEDAFVATFNDYVRTQLNFGQDLSYKPTNYAVGRDWDWSHRVDGFKSPIFDVAEDLREAMTENPHLLVFSANGYYDFATPFFETEYTLDHMGLDPSLLKNIRYGYYESGHMIYMHEPALKVLKADLAKFYDDAQH
jgi:carboxypeptidase C (cathepsin A)